MAESTPRSTPSRREGAVFRRRRCRPRKRGGTGQMHQPACGSKVLQGTLALELLEWEKASKYIRKPLELCGFNWNGTFLQDTGL
ncbi:hypothetical protein Y1Q_0007991 [Alligator mississippiensis]|uniref:Uncharacterized protein n=1 Tax=Alligator mississippiensis TaxID=8496 RepID=A0A151NF28_ALLMI|nr:hypothetical protein Y1Q_0007991 [Alligator mississippiensis]